jgi:hypothetical protein
MSASASALQAKANTDTNANRYANAYPHRNPKPYRHSNADDDDLLPLAEFSYTSNCLGSRHGLGRARCEVHIRRQGRSDRDQVLQG